MEIINALLPNLVEIAVLLLTALASYLGVLLKDYLNKQIALAKQKVKKEEWDLIVQLIAHTVSYVEQTFKTLKGEEKFREAQKTIIRLAQEQGLSLSEEQLKVITESFVNEFYSHIEEVLPKGLEGTE